jgi:energy-coupling factor transporter ATP-binding protein EcfA2
MRKHSLLACVVGGRGTGKTTFVRDIVKLSPKQKKIVVFTFPHPSYRDLKHINPIDLERLKSGTVFVYSSDIKELLGSLEKIKDSLIVFEDCRKYIDDNPQQEVKNICYDSKANNTDCIFLMHSLAEVPKKFFRWVDYIELFKTQEIIEDQKSRISCYQRIKPVFDVVKKSENKYFHKTIDLE